MQANLRGRLPWGQPLDNRALAGLARVGLRDNGRVTDTTPTPLELPGWRHVYSGKVRDLYVPGDAAEGAPAGRMLVVASDRVSAFDHVLSPGIPGKGTLLRAWQGLRR